MSFAEFGFDLTISFAIFHLHFLFLYSGAILEHSLLNENWRHVIDGALFAALCPAPSLYS